jgi:hypothetical protein
MKNTVINLNHLVIDDGNHDEEIAEAIARSRKSNNGSSNAIKTSVYFRDLEDSLIEKIKQYPVVIGCVAWLTNPRILEALSTRERVSIIIQKEDFLRPDTGSWSGEKLRMMYARLPCGVSHPYCSAEDWGDLIMRLNYNGSWESEPVRWMGEFNTKKSPAFPRLHNKFLVFCETYEYSYEHTDDDNEYDDDGNWIVPAYSFDEAGVLQVENKIVPGDAVVPQVAALAFERVKQLAASIDIQH